MLVMFVVLGLVELALFWQPIWKLRVAASALTILMLSAVITNSMVAQPNGVRLLLVLTGLFRVFNLVRIAEGRMHEAYLRSATRRTSLWLNFVTLLLALLDLVLANVSVSPFAWLVGVTLLQAIVAVVLAVTFIKNARASKFEPSSTHYSDKELPTVTVAIPARNETEDLADCLTSLLANDYPKLEILVLDDCSQDKTSEVIKSFAHKGVRFVLGTPAKSYWLAKNHAYRQLLDEATGHYVLFCGVDTRFSTDAIRTLVTEAKQAHLSMVSVMPKRLHGSLHVAFIQPMRYWWELVVPRKLFRRPAVLSTCWLIQRSAARKLGGFEAVTRSILPETHFARELQKVQGYRFIRANEQLDVQTNKTHAEQRATALRMRYPQVHHRPEMVLLLVVSEVLFLLGPYITLIFGLALSNGFIVGMAAFAASVGLALHVAIVYISNPANVPVALINYPFVLITELAIGLASMWKYEFSTITWKDRNVCIPVMHVEPHLPRLD
jgi:glycosyltransferase involved in cell wall biosynthesis